MKKEEITLAKYKKATEAWIKHGEIYTAFAELNKKQIQNIITVVGLPTKRNPEKGKITNDLMSKSLIFIHKYQYYGHIITALKHSGVKYYDFYCLYRENDGFRVSFDRAQNLVRTTKRCYKCDYTGPLDDFYVEKKKEKQRTGICKACAKEKNRKVTTEQKRKYQKKFYGQKDKRLESLVRNAKKNSAKTGVAFSITNEYIKDMWEKQQGKCYYTGWLMKIKCNTRDNHLVSLDRKTPSLGYVEGNVVLCCWVVNNGKNNLTEEQFYRLCSKIVETQNITKQQYLTHEHHHQF